jgi:hypothetical protein
MVPGVLKKHTAFFFHVKQPKKTVQPCKVKALRFFETSGTTHVTQHRIPDGLNT